MARVCFVFQTDLQTLSLITNLYHDPDDIKLTDYGFTGRSGTGSQREGLSIKRLQSKHIFNCRIPLALFPGSRACDNWNGLYRVAELEHLRLGIYDQFPACMEGWQEQEACVFTRRARVTLESVRELKFPKLKSLDLFLELESKLIVVSDPVQYSAYMGGH